MKVPIAVAVSVMALTLTACGSPATEPHASPTPSESSDSFRRLDPPPEQPPHVSVQGTVVAPSYFEWLDGGKPTTYKSSPDEDDSSLPSIRHAAGTDISLTIDASTRPADFVVVMYDKVGEDGVPRVDDGDQVDCLKDHDRCSFAQASDKVTATITTNDSPAIIVVHLAYLSKSPSGDKFEHLTGSWGVRTQNADTH